MHWSSIILEEILAFKTIKSISHCRPLWWNAVYRCFLCVCVREWDDRGYATFCSWGCTLARCLRLGAGLSGCEDFPGESVCVWWVGGRSGFAEESCGLRLSQRRCLQKIHEASLSVDWVNYAGVNVRIVNLQYLGMGIDFSSLIPCP